MMRSFELPHYRRANVWLGETLPGGFTAISVLTTLLKPKVAIAPSYLTAAVELLIPRGPTTSYALLGAELAVSETDGFEVVVAVNNVGSRFNSPFVLTPDEAMVGLPDEFAIAVHRGALTLAETVGAPTRVTLRYAWAAHGVVSSSPAVFEMASAIVLKLLMLPTGASDDLIRALFV
jgi:hypothetical protein